MQTKAKVPAGRQMVGTRERIENFFGPDERICLLLGNHDYKVLREGDANYAQFEDLPEVKDDLKNFTTNVKEYGFGGVDITKEQNLDYAMIKEAVDSARFKI